MPTNRLPANPPANDINNDQFNAVNDNEDVNDDDDNDVKPTHNDRTAPPNPKTLRALKELSTFYNPAAAQYVQCHLPQHDDATVTTSN